ncbi:MAG: DUF2341 domain-containing protein [Candidatus Thermoplasmatota archaeon]|nr:DUF2341 domain-containing protein [Candidatus Thermoplasmatota archaeon]MBU1941643.1 DUF2341 domain-containing protein [Candidatus Thermoplasmatota archaeon]
MYKNKFKIIGYGLVLILLITTYASSGAPKNQIDEHNMNITSESELSFDSQEAIVTCQLYGLGSKDTSCKSTLTYEEVETIQNLIKQIYQQMTYDPHSYNLQVLQKELIQSAKDYHLIPTDSPLATLPVFFNTTQPLIPRAQTQYHAQEYLCNYLSFGIGSAMPVIVLPRLIPILLTPIPRVYFKWNAAEGYTTCGGIRSGTGFQAFGKQTGTALGFWGMGFSIFLPPVQSYAILGYALYASVDADEIELWPPNYPPEITPIFPPNGGINVPVDTTELRFAITDRNDDLMSYSVTTQPYIGSANVNNVAEGTYSVSVSNIEGTQDYSWTVQVTDSENIVEETFTFSTEPVAPIVSNPAPYDGERFVSISQSQLRFHLRDPQGDRMDYTVETSPNIGSGNGIEVNEGYYSIAIGNLEFLANYTWFVNVTDGIHWKHETFKFQTEMMMDFNPYDEGWLYRKNITIDHTQVAGDLTNFPALISITDTDLRDKAQPNGDDILFMDDSGSAHRLWHEIESYEQSSGKLVAWVNITTISSSDDTTICIYYGNSECVSQAFAEYVWDSHFSAVWHMSDLHDSTINNNDLTNYGATITSGIINNCYSFDGIDDYMRFPPVIGSGKPLTMELWVAIQGTNMENSDSQGLFSPLKEKVTHVTFRKTAHSNIHQMSFYSDFYTGSSHVVDTGENSVTYGLMYNVVSMLDSSGTANIYMNGVLKDTYTGIGSLNTFSGRDNVIGAYDYSSSIKSYSFSLIDEIRVSKFIRSQEWIETQYNNQNNPLNFFIIGPEETGS